MELGICIHMNATPDEPSGVEQIPLYEEVGFDYLEVPASFLIVRPPDVRRRLEKALLASKLPCRSICNMFHPSIRLTGDNVDKDALDKYIEEAFSLASRLGVKNFVLGSGPARNIPTHFPLEKGWEQMVELFRRLGDRAAKDDVTIVIEHLNRLESNVIDSFEAGVAMCNQVAHPNIRCLVDYYHLALGREPLELMTANIGLIKHAHFANVLERSNPFDDRFEAGGLRYLTALKEAGYTGRLSVEGFSKSLDEFPRIVQFMRKHYG